MITFDIDYGNKVITHTLKNELKDITIDEYFKLIEIQSERLPIPVKEEDKFVDGTYEVKYYQIGAEPEDFQISKRNRIIMLLSDLTEEVLIDYPDLPELLVSQLKSFDDTSEVWKSKAHTNCIEKRDKISKKTIVEIVETDYVWTYDKPSDWCFQQWVDAENASKQHRLYPFLIALRKTKKDSKSRKAYDRSHPDFDDKLSYWLEQPAEGNLNTIYSILSSMSEVRNKFYWIYEAQTAFPEKEKSTMKIYSEFAGWNDVIVSLSETNAFNSNKGTLFAVRNANCIDVLEFLNWKRGKSFAEYEDWKIEERNSKFKNGAAL